MAKAKTTTPPSPPQKMVPTQSASISVEEVAKEIFVKTYMDTAGRTATHLAEQAFDAAESFVSVAESRR